MAYAIRNSMLYSTSHVVPSHHCYAVNVARTLDLNPVEGLSSPIAPYTGWKIASRIGLAPVLRAGISMTECARLERSRLYSKLIYRPHVPVKR